jgi:hypothetical protein
MAAERRRSHNGIVEVQAMARYYFHVLDHGAVIEDAEGVELSGVEAAVDECRQLILETLLGERVSDDFVGGRAFQVVDEKGLVLLVVPFRSLLDVRPASVS